ncbi:MAG: hypothetical protein M8350_00395 [Methanosarcinaceae archaeon]|nr:hypothetical protein [Methanosarcinaceae archaeon]
MKHERDFSWNTNKPISNHNVGKIIPVLPESFKEAIIKNGSHIDKNEKIDQLISAFKRRLSYIMSKEEEQ